MAQESESFCVSSFFELGRCYQLCIFKRRVLFESLNARFPEVGWNYGQSTGAIGLPSHISYQRDAVLWSPAVKLHLRTQSCQLTRNAHNLALRNAGPTHHLLSDNRKAVQSRNSVHLLPPQQSNQCQSAHGHQKTSVMQMRGSACQ